MEGNTDCTLLILTPNEMQPAPMKMALYQRKAKPHAGWVLRVGSRQEYLVHEVNFHSRIGTIVPGGSARAVWDYLLKVSNHLRLTPSLPIEVLLSRWMLLLPK